MGQTQETFYGFDAFSITMLVVILLIFIYRIYDRYCDYREAKLDASKCDHEYKIIHEDQSNEEILYVSRCEKCGKISEETIDRI